MRRYHQKSALYQMGIRHKWSFFSSNAFFKLHASFSVFALSNIALLLPEPYASC